MSSASGRIDSPSWFKPRGYIHFDHRISAERALRYVREPKKIERHSFFPFLAYTKSTPRYKPSKKKVELKNRDIYYASHLDSHIYAYYAHVLSGLHERALKGTPAEKSVLAYRRLGRSNIDFAYEAFVEIGQQAPCVAIAIDLSQFFDRLDHALLKAAWCDLLECSVLPGNHYAVYKSLTRFSSAKRDAVFREFSIPEDLAGTELRRICSPADFRTRVRDKGLIVRNPEAFGIPQGSPISAVLSNLYMLDFDQQIAAFAQKHGASYRRYCDDILLVCPEDVQAGFEKAVRDFLREIRLTVNDDKTERSSFVRDTAGRLVASSSLQYLGFVFDGKKVCIRAPSISRYYRRMKSAVRFAAKDAKKNQEHPRIYRDALYRKYTHLGGRNFFSYGKRASKKMDMPSVMRQLARHWRKLHDEIAKRSMVVEGQNAVGLSASMLSGLVAVDDGSLTGSSHHPSPPAGNTGPVLQASTTGSTLLPTSLDSTPGVGGQVQDKI